MRTDRVGQDDGAGQFVTDRHVHSRLPGAELGPVDRPGRLLDEGGLPDPHHGAAGQVGEHPVRRDLVSIRHVR